MNDHFDRHRDQLTDEEKARVWQNLERHARGEEMEPLRTAARGPVSTNSNPRPRWRSWWLAPIGAAAVAAVLLVILLSDGREPQMRMQAPAADTGMLESKEQASPQTSMLDSEPEPKSESDSDHESAAPGGRQATVPVPSPSATSRQAAEEARPPATRSRVDIRTSGADGTIAGRVTDGDGKPISLANVRLFEEPIGAATDSLGNFELRHVPDGVYSLRVSAKGFEPIFEDSLRVASGNGLLMAATLVPDRLGPVADVTVLRGGEGGVIAGRVSDLDGKPLAYANVVLVGTRWGATTDTKGEFAIRNLPDGVYDVRVLMMGFTPGTADSVRVSADDGALVAATIDSEPVGSLAELEIAAIKKAVREKRTDTSHVISSKDMESLPVDEITDMIGLKAGVIGKEGEEIHFRGGRAGDVQYQVDGVQVRDPLGANAPDVASAEKHQEMTSKQPASAPTPIEVQTWGAIRDHSEEKDKSARGLDAQYGNAWSPARETNSQVARSYSATPPTPAPSADPITGGTALPNDEPFDAMYFESEGVNPFIDTRDDAQSTFAVDVDRASYTITREYLGRGYLPPRDAIRVEEFVNAFDPGYPEFTEPDFRIFVDGSPAPFRPNHQLVRVGIQGRSVDAEDRKPTDLVFVIDVSGSMNREDRLQTVKRALGLLLDQLRPSDRVAIVVYETRSRVVLRPTSVEDRTIIQSHIDALSPSGSTNAEEGLRIGYELAREMRTPGRQTRILLCADGVANEGQTASASIFDTVRRESDRGIYLSTIGFGMGNYNDVLMEQLADDGDGAAYYVDSIEEAERVFVSELSGTLQTIGRDAKIQVEFDPSVVERYRLLGYENRDVADRDFRNDAVDAGEIGAGHTVTALYEVRLADNAPRNRRLGVVRFRWERPREDGGWSSGPGEVREIERGIESTDITASVSRGSANLRMAAAAAELAEILRGSFWAKEHSIDGALELAKGAAEELGTEEAGELVTVIQRVKELRAQGR